MTGAWITRLRQALCPHAHRVRERRDTTRAPRVLHFVCVQCGDAVPAITRTTREQLEAIRRGHVRRPRVRHTPRAAEVTE